MRSALMIAAICLAPTVDAASTQNDKHAFEALAQVRVTQTERPPDPFAGDVRTDPAAFMALIDELRRTSAALELERSCVGVAQPLRQAERTEHAHRLIEVGARGPLIVGLFLEDWSGDMAQSDRLAVLLDGPLDLLAARGAITVAFEGMGLDGEERSRLATAALAIAEMYQAEYAEAGVIGGHALRYLGRPDDAVAMYRAARTLDAQPAGLSPLLEAEALLGSVLAAQEEGAETQLVLTALDRVRSTPLFSGQGESRTLHLRLSLLEAQARYRVLDRSGAGPAISGAPMTDLYQRLHGASTEQAALRAGVYDSAGAIAASRLRSGSSPGELPPIAVVGVLATTRPGSPQAALVESAAAALIDSEPTGSTSPIIVDAAYELARHGLLGDNRFALRRAIAAEPTDDRAYDGAIHVLRAGGEIAPLTFDRLSEIARASSGRDDGRLDLAAAGYCLRRIVESRSNVERRMYLDQGLAAVRSAAERGAEVAALSIRLRSAASRLIGDAEEHAQAVRGIVEQSLSTGTPLDARSLVHAADALLAAGDASGATGITQRVLAGTERGPDDAALSVLAHALIASGAEEDAVALAVEHGLGILEARQPGLFGQRRAVLTQDVRTTPALFIADQRNSELGWSTEAAHLRVRLLASAQPDAGLARDVAVALLIAGRITDAARICDRFVVDGLVHAEVLLALDDEAGAFTRFRDIATSRAAQTEDEGYWHAWTRMLEILERQNSGGSRTQGIRDAVRRLRALPSWGEHTECARRIEAVASRLD